MEGDADEQLVRQSLAALEHGLLALDVEFDDASVRHVLDVARVESVEEGLGDLGGDWNRGGHRADHADLSRVPDPTRDEMVVQQECALERRRRALERLAEDPDRIVPDSNAGSASRSRSAPAME